MSATGEAIDMATVAATAAAAKLADDVIVIDVSAQLVITSRHAAREPAKAAGHCWITATSSCTSSIRTTATSTPWTGYGVIAPWCR